jgi:predicted acylesterase/phospholipase RssA
MTTPSTSPISLVLAGGGVRALAHVGAITRLVQEKHLDTVTHYAGSSAGAIVAALMAAQYTIKELFEYMMQLNLRDFAKDGLVKEGVNLVKTYGIHDNSKLEQSVEQGIAAKLGSNATFRQLKTRTGNTLVVTATNLSTSQTDVFSAEKTPDMVISKAIRLSADIPLFFTSCEHDGCVYTDGGLLNNLPIDLVPTPTLAINLTSSGVLPRRINNIDSYLYALLETVSDAVDKLRPKTGDVIDIDTGDVASTDFDIGLIQKMALVKKGYFFQSDLVPSAPPSIPGYWYETHRNSTGTSGSYRGSCAIQ